MRINLYINAQLIIPCNTYCRFIVGDLFEKWLGNCRYTDPSNLESIKTWGIQLYCLQSHNNTYYSPRYYWYSTITAWDKTCILPKKWNIYDQTRYPVSWKCCTLYNSFSSRKFRRNVLNILCNTPDFPFCNCRIFGHQKRQLELVNLRRSIEEFLQFGLTISLGKNYFKMRRFCRKSTLNDFCIFVR